MQSITLDSSRLYGFRILQGGSASPELDSRVGGKIGIPKMPEATLDNRLGSKAGIVKMPDREFDARLGPKLGQSKIDR